MLIRPLAPSDAEALGAVLLPVIHAGDAYALPRDLGQDGALAYWCGPGHEVFVAETGGRKCGAPASGGDEREKTRRTRSAPGTRESKRSAPAPGEGTTEENAARSEYAPRIAPVARPVMRHAHPPPRGFEHN